MPEGSPEEQVNADLYDSLAVPNIVSHLSFRPNPLYLAVHKNTKSAYIELEEGVEWKYMKISPRLRWY